MSSLSELRKELRELRKESVKPVSRMRKGDIMSEIERMREVRETTAAPAATPSAPNKKVAPKRATVKEAKVAEFSVAPVKAAPKAAKKGGMSKAQMRAMLEELTSDEE